jgi:hypothetical protein
MKVSPVTGTLRYPFHYLARRPHIGINRPLCLTGDELLVLLQEELISALIFRLVVAISLPGIAPLKIFCYEFSRLISSKAEKIFRLFLFTFSQTGERMQEELVAKGSFYSELFVTS